MPRYIDAEGLNLYDNLFMSEDTINKSGVYVRYRAVENLIKNAPTADVQEVRHAHWVQPNPYCKPFCSGCNTFEQTGEKKNYCSECGAKMDEKENDK